MEIRQILKKYYNRLVKEAIIKSFTCGATMGLGIGILIMGASWLSTAKEGLIPWLPQFNGTWLSISICLMITIIGALFLYLWRFRPDMKEAARRVDKLGLDERAITMIVMENSDNYIAKLQREDAVEHLGKIPQSHLKLSIFKLPIVLAFICLIFMSTILIIPNAQGIYASAYQIDEQEIIDELIADLRDDIENAEGVRGEIKNELNGIVDKLEEDLGSMSSTDEKINAIKETSDKIHEAIQKEQTHTQLGEALKEFENTSELGDAILNRDRNELNEALDNIKDKIDQAGKDSDKEMSDELKDLAESIDKAIDKAGKENDALSDALKDLSSKLKDAIAESDKGNDKESSEKTEEAIENAKDDIGNALDDQKNNAELGDNMQESINGALDKLEPNAPSQGDQGEDCVGNSGNSNMPPQEDKPPQSGEDGKGENEPTDPSGSGEHDPKYDEYGNSFKDGETPYTDEFDKYFKQEMARLENEDITDAEREMIAKYFAFMMVKKDTE